MSQTNRHQLIFCSLKTVSPWAELGISVPASLRAEPCPLTQIQNFTLAQNTQVKAILVDLDDVAKTEPLDEWALQAWRATFNDLILRATLVQSESPLLLGYCRDKDWQKAELGVKIGVRALCLLSELNSQLAKFTSPDESAFESEKAEPSNLIKLPTRDSSAQPSEATTSTLGEDFEAEPAIRSMPKHSIPFPIEGLEGSSAAIEGVRNMVRKSAPLDTSVLIVGATGSGKELVARTLHRYSARAKGPFIAVNCGALAPNLVEAELFGFVQGAFTGALHDKVGLLAAANGGSLFLDEITELPLEFQVKLLRALQDRAVTPVGSHKSVALDLRLISASKDDVEERLRNGQFREDLLFRVRVIEINLPSLSERKADISDVSKTILKKLARRHRRPSPVISEDVMEKFLLHPWPGNVRELENVLEHASTLCWAESRSLLEIKDLPESVQFASMNVSPQHELKEMVRKFEREYIASTVRRLGGSKEMAAESLGLSLATLYRKLGTSD